MSSITSITEATKPHKDYAPPQRGDEPLQNAAKQAKGVDPFLAHSITSWQAIDENILGSGFSYLPFLQARKIQAITLTNGFSPLSPKNEDLEDVTYKITHLPGRVLRPLLLGPRLRS
jgi:hypothetical protein